VETTRKVSTVLASHAVLYVRHAAMPFALSSGPSSRISAMAPSYQPGKSRRQEPHADEDQRLAHPNPAILLDG
jgi:hypothetical protein